MSNAIKAIAAVAGIAAVGAAAYYGIRKWEDKKFNDLVNEHHGKHTAKFGGEFKVEREEKKLDGVKNVKVVSRQSTEDADIVVTTHGSQNRKAGLNMALTTSLTIPKVKAVVRNKPAVKTAAKKAAVKPLRKAA